MTDQPRDTPQFYLTAPTACPYLPGHEERKVFTHLVGERAPALNDALTQGGFRRSQSIAYRPACDGCRACISVRVVVNDFVPNKAMKRVLKRNAELSGEMIKANPTSEQYSLFRAYLDARHGEGGMAEMSVFDYAMMVEDSHVRTRLVEYRQPPDQTGKAELVGVVLTDILSDGLSMVYSFYDPEMMDRSLGTLMILDHIARAKMMGLPYLYLGYWVDGSPKMAYKTRFGPQERLMPQGWEYIEAADRD